MDVFYDAVYQDKIDRQTLRAPEQLAEALPPQPERTAIFFDAVYVDKVDRRVAQQQQTFADPTSQEIPVTTVNFFDAKYADRVDRKLPQPFQQALAFAPQPEATAVFFKAVYPDKVDRKLERSVDQLAEPFASLRPERTNVFFDAQYPDHIDRKLERAADHLAQPFASLQPEITLPESLAKYVDRVDRKVLLATQQQVLAFAPQPERTGVNFDAAYQDRVYRETFKAPQQLAEPFAALRPETTNVFFKAIYPDRVDRRTLPSAAQLFFTFAPQPERSQVFYNTSYPDRIDRQTFKTAEQIASTLETPYPERTIFFDAVYLDKIDPKRSLAPSSQQTLAFASQPERTAINFGNIHPDKIDRSTFKAPYQLPELFASLKPESTTVFFDAAYPYKIYPQCSRSLGVSLQQAFATSSQPERVAFFDAQYPDNFTRSPIVLLLNYRTDDVPSTPLPPLPLVVYPQRIETNLNLLTVRQGYRTDVPQPSAPLPPLAVAVYPQRIESDLRIIPRVPLRPVRPSTLVAKNEITPAGGTLVMDQWVEVVVPAGAIVAPILLVVTLTAAVPPTVQGLIAAISPFYTFEPDVPLFGVPVTVSIAVTGDGAGAVLFWSNDQGGYDIIPSTFAGGFVTGQVDGIHSTGFVGFAVASSGGGGGGSSAGGGSGTVGDGVWRELDPFDVAEAEAQVEREEHRERAAKQDIDVWLADVGLDVIAVLDAPSNKALVVVGSKQLEPVTAGADVGTLESSATAPALDTAVIVDDADISDD